MKIPSLLWLAAIAALGGCAATEGPPLAKVNADAPWFQLNPDQWTFRPAGLGQPADESTPERPVLPPVLLGNIGSLSHE